MQIQLIQMSIERRRNKTNHRKVTRTPQKLIEPNANKSNLNKSQSNNQKQEIEPRTCSRNRTANSINGTARKYLLIYTNTRN